MYSYSYYFKHLLMKKLTKAVIVGAAGFAPLLAFAAQITDIQSIVSVLNSILSTIIPFVIGLAVLVILWGVFNYISGAGDEEKRGEAKQYIIWGIIGLFVMVSIWGLVNVLESTFTTTKTVLPAPGFPAATTAIPVGYKQCPNGTMIPIANSC